MISLTQHLQLEVSCPTCSESYSVPLDLVEESQHLIDELGPCSGMASYECPAPYFASLASPEAVTHFQGALRELERDALQHGTKAVWVEPGATTEPPSELSRIKTIAAAAAALALALARWENEGGALGATS